MIRQSRQSTLLLLIHSQKSFKKKAKVKNWPCCRKWRTREAHISCTSFGVRLRQDCRLRHSFS